MLCEAHLPAHVSPGWVLYCGRDAHWARISVSEEAFFLERLLDQTGLNRVGPGVIWAPIPRWVRVRLRVGPQAHSLILEISPLQ